MLRGTRAVYVDYVDYDEISHHAGMLRPESLEALEAVDGVLHQLELVAKVAPRPYHFVVLSDHGQAQGATFRDRYGEELGELVSRLSSADVTSREGDIEGWGRTRVLVEELAAGSGLGARAMRNVAGSMERGEDPSEQAVAGSSKSSSAGGAPQADDTFHVFGSGNLGLIYVRGERRQLTLQQLDRRFPALVDGLARHPGVGFVVVTDEVQGPVVLGRSGSRRLDDGHVEGDDPLLPFGELAPEFVRRVASRPETPDIYVNSLLEPGTDEVAAFEGLVGCHGDSAAGRTGPSSSYRRRCRSPPRGSSEPTRSTSPSSGSCATSGTARTLPMRRSPPPRMGLVGRFRVLVQETWESRSRPET